MAEPLKEDRRRITAILPISLIERIDSLKAEWGHRNRSDLLVHLLEEIFRESDGRDGDGLEAEEPGGSAPHPLDESGALVLVPHDDGSLVPLEPDDLAEALDPSTGERAGGPVPGPLASTSAPSRRNSPTVRRGSGIDLPGFVRQSSAQLRQSLNPPAATGSGSVEPLPLVSAEDIQPAITAVREHWRDLYGAEAGEPVLEAAMVWLAQDIWPQSDQAEGRPFTWSVLERWVGGFAPGWPVGEPSFERVIVAAGLLEDPFSAATLSLRIPTLVRRFVHRMRRRRRGTSFQALEHTMTIHGALRLLNLPTAPGHRLTLEQIREAYREQALSHHPDSGGDADAMRRLNEAYQLLKELYRRPA